MPASWIRAFVPTDMGRVTVGTGALDKSIREEALAVRTIQLWTGYWLDETAIIKLVIECLTECDVCGVVCDRVIV